MVEKPQPPTPPKAPARPKREEHTPVAGPALDAKGQALSQYLSEALAPFSPQVTAALDEVVVTVDSKHLLEVCRTVRSNPRLAFDFLRCLSVVDYKDSFQVVYHLWSMELRHKAVIKTNVPASNPVAPSVILIWPAADWFEREGHDLFGVVFEGHPNLKPLLLYEGFEGYPGRRSYPLYDYKEW